MTPTWQELNMITTLAAQLEGKKEVLIHTYVPLGSRNGLNVDITAGFSATKPDGASDLAVVDIVTELFGLWATVHAGGNGNMSWAVPETAGNIDFAEVLHNSTNPVPDGNAEGYYVLSVALAPVVQ